MSLSRIRRGARFGRRAALLSTLLPASLVAGASTAAATPVSLNLNYVCSFPLMAPQPLALHIASDIPSTVQASEPTPAFAITAEAVVSADSTRGLRALEAVSVEGTATAAARLTNPSGSGLNLAVPTVVPKTDIPASGAFTTSATGETPSLTLDEPGAVKITISDLVLNLRPRLVDGTLSGLNDLETECIQVPGQNNVFATINVVDGTLDTAAPTVPGGLTAVPAPSSIALSWAPSTDNVGVAGYDVFRGGQQVASVTTPTATISGLSASTSYRFTVRARDAAGNASAQSPELVTSTTGTGTTAYRYKTAGTAQIKTLTRGAVAIKGTMNASIVADTGALTADLLFDQATARLTALGFLPVTAKVGFVTSGVSTGKLAGGVLTVNAKLRTKVQEVRLFGAIPLGGGNSCQTKSFSDVKLVSAGTNFQPAAGGALAGTFAISDLNGCGALNGLVSPLTAGSGNTLSLTLTPNAAA